MSRLAGAQPGWASRELTASRLAEAQQGWGRGAPMATELEQSTNTFLSCLEPIGWLLYLVRALVFFQNRRLRRAVRLQTETRLIFGRGGARRPPCSFAAALAFSAPRTSDYVNGIWAALRGEGAEAATITMDWCFIFHPPPCAGRLGAGSARGDKGWWPRIGRLPVFPGSKTAVAPRTVLADPS